MIIDIHVHPIYFDAICGDRSREQLRSAQFGIYKQSPYTLEEVLVEMDYGGIDKAVLLAEDLTTQAGDTIVSNAEIQKIVELQPDQFYGFASVDPYRQDAVQVLDDAFKHQGLAGLKLNPSKQRFFPADDLLKPIYRKCLDYNKPLLFHAGMSWEPNAPARYSQPVNFEDVAISYPELRICLAHFGWPWVSETVMLMLKYPNIYTDTSFLYLDSPKEFYEQIFTRTMGPHWLDNNFNDQMLFGSNTPRFRAFKLKAGLEALDLRQSTRQKLFGDNALKFLGLKAK